MQILQRPPLTVLAAYAMHGAPLHSDHATTGTPLCMAFSLADLPAATLQILLDGEAEFRDGGEQGEK